MRDAVLGRISKDFDVVTDAEVEELGRIFEKTVQVGKEFGVTVVVQDSVSVEVARFRKDTEYVDGRRPVRVLAGTPEEDARRRDFTMNALFYDINKECLIDFVEGKKDIEHQLIRAVGDPMERMKEDKLRLLRAVRFVSELGFKLEPGLHLAIKSLSAEISIVSRERILAEMDRLLVGPNRGHALSLSVDLGLFSEVLRGIAEINEDSIKTFMGELSRRQHNSDPDFVWTLLFHVCRDSAQHARDLSILRMSRSRLAKIQRGLNYMDLFFSDRTLGEKIFELKTNAKEIIDFLRWYLPVNPNKEELKLRAFLDQFVDLGWEKNFPPPLTTARDLMSEGFIGEGIGREFKLRYMSQLETLFVCPRDRTPT